MDVRALRTLAGALALAFATACDVPQAPEPSLEIGVVVPTKSLDPARGNDPGRELVARFAFQTLPQIAQITRGPDARTWFVTIAPGLRFSDGTKLDADAVGANLARWSSGRAGYAAYAHLFGSVSPYEIQTFGNFGPSQRLSISTRVPFPKFVEALRDPHLSIVSPASFANRGALDAIPRGSGAYEISTFVPGNHIELVPAAGRPTPHYASIRIDEIPDPHTAVLSLEKADVAVVYGFPESYLAEARANQLHPVHEPATGLWCAFAAGLLKSLRVCPPGASLDAPRAERNAP